MLIRCFFWQASHSWTSFFSSRFMEDQKNPCFIAFPAIALVPMCAPQNPLWISLRSSTPFFDVIHLSHSAVGWRSPRMSDRSLAIAKCRCVCRSCAVVLRSSFCVCRTGCSTCCGQSNRRIHDKIALQPVALAPLILEEARRWGRAGFAGIGSLNRLRL
jgi:hypothetical protein